MTNPITSRLIGTFLLLLPVLCSAQQNLFNVPTSDITPVKKLFFQQQFNITDISVQLNSTFSYGLGHNMEFGVNVIGVNLGTNASGVMLITNNNAAISPVYPFYTVNFQKAFKLSEVWRLAAGTQTGFAAGGHFGSYVWTNAVAVLPRSKTKIIGGIYWASDSFLGPEDRTLFFGGNDSFGTQVGVEQPVFSEKFVLIAESISGQHSLGETSLGGAYRFTDHLVLSAAYQFPNYNGKAVEALIMELTYVP